MSDSVIDLQHSLRPLLAPFGACYSGAMMLRQSLYQSGAFRSWRPASICVSVGNIGWGGTGKTPLVSWLLSWANRRQLRAAVLTRGYRAQPKRLPYLVSGGALAEEAGDEPLMLARQHPNAAIVVDPIRARGGRFVEMETSPHLYVLDDGFQHMAVARDVNLVLMKPEDFTSQWNRVIPSGSWREGWGALERGDCYLVKSSPREFKNMAETIRKRMVRFGKPIFSFSMRPTGLRRITDGELVPDFGGEPYILVSGVGDPGQVEVTVRRFLGSGPEIHRDYRDHHLYTRSDVTELEKVAKAYGCENIVCTPKDAVKLGPMASRRFWTIELDLSFGPSLGSAKPFSQWWSDRYDTFYLKQFGQLPAPGRGGDIGEHGELDHDVDLEEDWDGTLVVSEELENQSDKD